MVNASQFSRKRSSRSFIRSRIHEGEPRGARKISSLSQNITRSNTASNRKDGSPRRSWGSRDARRNGIVVKKSPAKAQGVAKSIVPDEDYDDMFLESAPEPLTSVRHVVKTEPEGLLKADDGQEAFFYDWEESQTAERAPKSLTPSTDPEVIVLDDSSDGDSSKASASEEEEDIDESASDSDSDRESCSSIAGPDDDSQAETSSEEGKVQKMSDDEFENLENMTQTDVDDMPICSQENTSSEEDDEEPYEDEEEPYKEEEEACEEEFLIPRRCESEDLLKSVYQAHEIQERAMIMARGEVYEEESKFSRPMSSGRRLSRAQRSRDACQKRNSAGSIEEIEIEWEQTLEMVTPEFLRGDFALMKKLDGSRVGIKGGRSLYRAISIHPINNADLSYIYRVGYSARASAQSPTCGTFAQFRSTFGQLCRFLLALRLVDPQELYKEGAVFKALKHEVFEPFLRFFRFHAASSTLAQKANHCNIICHHGIRFFNVEGEPRAAAKLDEVREYVKGIHSNAKSQARIDAGHRTKEIRAAEHKYLSAEDMKRLRVKALEQLHACVHAIKEKKKGKKGSDIVQELSEQPKIIAKFSINFLVALIMTGSGQRPQVYSSLLLPTLDEMKQWKKDVTIKVSREKTPRLRPYIYFHDAVKAPVYAYVTFVRPAICILHKVPETEKSLILHTRTGYPIDTTSVRPTFQAFAKMVDPEYSRITPMNVRASYATDMLTRFRKGDFGDAKSEKQFVSDLALAMNTSPDMLHSHYIAISDKDYLDSVKYLTSHMDREEYVDQADYE